MDTFRTALVPMRQCHWLLCLVWVACLFPATEPRNTSFTCCAVPPSKVQHSNEFWQTQKITDGKLQLFGAYLDKRIKIQGRRQFVRILGVSSIYLDGFKLSCQFWNSRSVSIGVEPVYFTNYIWFKEWEKDPTNASEPYLLSCLLPRRLEKTAPVFVSVVENNCDVATNFLRIKYQKSNTQEMFAVCVKPLDFLYADISKRLVEWIELLGLLGAHKIFFYKLEVHSNVSRVLEYYRKRGKVDVQSFKLPGVLYTQSDGQHTFLKKNKVQKRKLELIPYNDCLYRNMYKYKYVTLLDVDEVIMPKKNKHDWHDLVKSLHKAIASNETSRDQFTGFAFRNAYFLVRNELSSVFVLLSSFSH